MFTFNGKEYPTVGDVHRQVGKFHTLQQEFEFLDEYKKATPHAISNLRYFLGGCPYWIAFKTKHALAAKLKKAKEEIEKLEREMDIEFDKFMEGR